MWHSHRTKWFYYTKSQRKGVVLFYLLLFLIQGIVFYCTLFYKNTDTSINLIDPNQLILYHIKIDSIRKVVNKKKILFIPSTQILLVIIKASLWECLSKKLIGYTSLGRQITM